MSKLTASKYAWVVDPQLIHEAIAGIANLPARAWSPLAIFMDSPTSIGVESWDGEYYSQTSIPLLRETELSTDKLYLDLGTFLSIASNFKQLAIDRDPHKFGATIVTESGTFGLETYRQPDGFPKIPTIRKEDPTWSPFEHSSQALKAMYDFTTAGAKITPSRVHWTGSVLTGFFLLSSVQVQTLSSSPANTVIGFRRQDLLAVSSRSSPGSLYTMDKNRIWIKSERSVLSFPVQVAQVVRFQDVASGEGEGYYTLSTKSLKLAMRILSKWVQSDSVSLLPDGDKAILMASKARMEVGTCKVPVGSKPVILPIDLLKSSLNSLPVDTEVTLQVTAKGVSFQVETGGSRGRYSMARMKG